MIQKSKPALQLRKRDGRPQRRRPSRLFFSIWMDDRERKLWYN